MLLPEARRLVVLLRGSPTRVLFFTGKGGVGKTSVACATGLQLARAGRKVLIVSTDPASNLDEVLGAGLGAAPREVPGAPGLYAANLDPLASAAAYRERVVGPYRGLLPAAAIRSMEEQLSGACTVEIAAFDEFSRLLGDPKATAEFDHVLFDTAPTGHTLRLLALPSAWTGYLESSAGGTSCLGPLAGLEGQRHLYAASVAALADRTQTTIVLVARPERAALREAERTRVELDALGITNQVLVVNGVFTPTDATDGVAQAMARRGAEALSGMAAALGNLPRTDIPLLGTAPMGIAGLAGLGGPCAEEQVEVREIPVPGTLTRLVDDIVGAGHGVVMTMGKGGVGKTTIAAAIAVEIARRGHRVHLSTTDPAAHVADAVDTVVPGLTVGRIDPHAETEQYRAEVLARAGAALDDPGRALLEEDLRSPCTEEIAVFRAFARTVAAGAGSFVVLDTAPTGHTLLLLDASEAYHREVARTVSDTPEFVRALLPRLRDPGFTRVLLVTLPEATPVHEAALLGRDLERAGIAPFAWVVNASLAPLTVHDPVLRARREHERAFIQEVMATGARAAIVAWQAEAPTGPERLGLLLK